MKSVAAPLVTAIVLALAGGAFWLVGHAETRIADMHKELAMLHYEEVDSEGEAVEQGLGLERRMPLVGKAAEADVRDTRAVAGYALIATGFWTLALTLQLTVPYFRKFP